MAVLAVLREVGPKTGSDAEPGVRGVPLGLTGETLTKPDNSAAGSETPGPPAKLPANFKDWDAGPPNLSLSNGTELRKRRHLNGHGELTVENGSSFDAVVHLVDLNSNRAIRTFYVRASAQFTERQIAPGLYGVYFTTGNDWNPELKLFKSNASYSQFGRNVEYLEKSDPDNGKIEYSKYEITLNPVLGGDVKTFPSDKNAFDNLMNDPTTN